MTSWRRGTDTTRSHPSIKYSIRNLTIGNNPQNQKPKSFTLHKAVQYRNIHKIRILLPETEDINKKNDNGDTVLLLGCEQDKNLEEILDLLFTRNDIDITITNNELFNALHILAFRGNLKGMVKIMNKFRNVDVDALNDKENTPLMMASKMDHVDIIEYLAAKGANVNHKNNKQFTALHYAANNGYTRSLAALIRLGADINAKDDYGLTPLIKACKWSFLSCCEILVQKGADVNYGNSTHITALRSACYRDSKDNVELVKLLISHGAEVNYPGDFSTAFFECAKLGNVACAEVLINANVDITKKTKAGKNALYIAKQHKRLNMVELLKKYFNEP